MSFAKTAFTWQQSDKLSLSYLLNVRNKYYITSVLCNYRFSQLSLRVSDEFDGQFMNKGFARMQTMNARYLI